MIYYYLKDDFVETERYNYYDMRWNIINNEWLDDDELKEPKAAAAIAKKIVNVPASEVRWRYQSVYSLIMPCAGRY